MKIFGDRLRELREKSGMTQQQLAERIWVSKAAISNYELYERNPSPEILIKLAKVFHVSTDYLLGIEEERLFLDISGLDDEDILIIKNTAEHLKKKNTQRTRQKEKERQK